MDVLEAIKERRSVRAFTDKKASEEDVERTRAALNQTLIQKAPVVIVVCADVTWSSRGYGKRGEQLCSIQNTAVATQNILLAAQELGLATCWIGVFHEKEAEKAVNAPINIKPVAIVPVGYPAVREKAPQKRAVNELFTTRHFGGNMMMDEWH